VLYGLVDFYASYRAWIRGKVAALVADDANASVGARQFAAKDARRYFALASTMNRPPLLNPTLVCVGGLMGAGKSTLAGALADALNCPAVEADRTRKRMLGVAETHALSESVWQGAYDPAVTQRVYGELMRRASSVLTSGRPVVVDASFRLRAARSEAREIARAQGVRFLFVECRAPADVCRSGSREEARDRPRATDASRSSTTSRRALRASRRSVPRSTRSSIRVARSKKTSKAYEPESRCGRRT
jgi:uncharacterized protein